MRDPNKLIKNKENKLKYKMQQSRSEDRKAGRNNGSTEKFIGGGKRTYSQKAKNKIVASSKPTRSKMIVRQNSGRKKR